MRVGESPEDKKLVSDVLGVFSRLKEERRMYEAIWKEVTDYVYPRRSAWQFETTMDSFGEKIFDGTAIAAHNMLADGIFGWMCSPAIDWLDFQPEDKKYLDNSQMMRYLDDLKRYLYEVLSRSNFYDAESEDIHDCSALGTSVMVLDENPKNGNPVYFPLHLREVYISENAYGEVDTLYRDFEMTNRQLAEKFGDGLTDEQKKRAVSNPEERVRVLHAQWPREVSISPEDEMKPRIKTEKKVASVYILCGQGAARIASGGSLLENGGMDSRNFEAWRFRKAPGEVYGWSPPMDGIFDIKMLNLISKTMADVAQLAARPPVTAPESLRGKIKIRPEGINYVVGDEQIRPIMTTLSYPFGKDQIEQKIAVIREHFKSDFFMMASQIQNNSRQRTATEIMELKSESAAALGPIIGRVQMERLDPIIRMTIANEAKHERLPPPPSGLPTDAAFRIVYTGPLAQAQRKYLMVQGINQGLSQSLQYAQVDPNIIYNFDLNGAVRELAVASGLPYKLLVPSNEANKTIEQARQAQAQAAEREQRRLDAQANASKAVAPEPGSQLEAEMAQAMGKEM